MSSSDQKGAGEARAKPTLHALGQRYGTDKVTHGYLPPYDLLLTPVRESAVHVMEIGVMYGASILMWRDYFTKAVIHGMDTFCGVQGNGIHTFANPTAFYDRCERENDPRLQMHKVDQSDKTALEGFSRECKVQFDMILDDASHRMRDQQQTFATLFSLVKPGGYYIIEDIGTCYTGYDNLPDRSNATLFMVHHYNLTKKIYSQYMTEAEKQFLQDNIAECTLIAVKEHSITCAFKRK